MRRLSLHLRDRWHHRTIGELYLLVTIFGSSAYGLLLLVAPARMTTSPAFATLYAIAPRATWGVVFLLLAGLAGWAALYPTEQRFVGVLSVVVGAHTMWAAGLTAPSLTGAGVSNLLAPIAWLQLIGTALVVITSGRRPVLPPPANKGRRRTDRRV